MPHRSNAPSLSRSHRSCGGIRLDPLLSCLVSHALSVLLSLFLPQPTSLSLQGSSLLLAFEECPLDLRTFLDALEEPMAASQIKIAFRHLLSGIRHVHSHCTYFPFTLTYFPFTLTYFPFMYYILSIIVRTFHSLLTYFPPAFPHPVSPPSLSRHISIPHPSEM